MSRTKKILSIMEVLAAVVFLSMSCGVMEASAMNKSAKQKCETVEDTICKRYSNHYNLKVKIYNAENLTNKKLRSRKNSGKVIVEKVTGIVANARTGAGNVEKVKNWYICYKHVKGIRNGSRVVSYFVYDPKTNRMDDIIDRYDVVVKK